MSDYLLQKSIKLLQDSKQIKKSKRAEKIKKKKNLLNAKQLEKQEFNDNILRNLEKLEKLNQDIEVDVSEEVLSKLYKTNKCDSNASEEVEESTVFTEQDFEDFEREYFDS